MALTALQPVTKGTALAKWFFEIEEGIRKGTLQQWPDDCCHELERMYEQWRIGHGSTDVVIDSGNFKYNINFDLMTQTNITTQVVRKLSRVEDAATNLDPMLALTAMEQLDAAQRAEHMGCQLAPSCDAFEISLDPPKNTPNSTFIEICGHVLVDVEFQELEIEETAGNAPSGGRNLNFRILKPNEAAHEDGAPDLPAMSGAPQMEEMQIALPEEPKNIKVEKVTQKSKADEEKLGCCDCCPGHVPKDPSLESISWMIYLVCAGIGRADELGGCFVKSDCCGSSLACIPVPANSVDVDGDGVTDGMCGYISTCTCCTVLFQLPVRPGTPACICCNIDPFSRDPEKPTDPHYDRQDGPEPNLTFWDFSIFNSFVCCYCICCGYVLHRNFIEIHNSFSKCSGCLLKCLISPPCDDEMALNLNYFGYCGCWKCREECILPPKPIAGGNPIVACCGCQLCWPRTHSGQRAKPNQSNSDVDEVAQTEDIWANEGYR